MITIEEYLHTSFRPDCDFVDGEVRERNVGMRRHSYALGAIGSWFIRRRKDLGLEALCALRMRVSPSRVRIPDVVVSEMPLPDEEVFTSPPYLCIEVMSPDDTLAALQDRIDELSSIRCAERMGNRPLLQERRYAPRVAGYCRG